MINLSTTEDQIIRLAALSHDGFTMPIETLESLNAMLRDHSAMKAEIERLEAELDEHDRYIQENFEYL